MKLFQFEQSKSFDRNRKQAGRHGKGGESYCVLCGKVLTFYNNRFVHLVAGGNYALHPSDEESYVSNGGDLSFWPVGPECQKKFGAYVYNEGEFSKAILSSAPKEESERSFRKMS